MHANLFTDTMPLPTTHDDSVTRCSLCGWEVIACQCKATKGLMPLPRPPRQPSWWPTSALRRAVHGEEEPGGADLLLLPVLVLVRASPVPIVS